MGEIAGGGSRLRLSAQETHVFPLLHMKGEVSEINLELQSPKGKRIPVLINAIKAELGNDKNPVFYFTIIDISQRKLYEKELLEARKKADEKRRELEQINDQLERFAYTVSHDLKAPLNTISGIVQLLELSGAVENQSERDKYFEMIKLNIHRMQRMTTDLLEHARSVQKPENLKPVNLNAVCGAVLDILNDDINKNDAKINVNLLPDVLGTETQLIRLFQNLISNAIRYRSEKLPQINISWELQGDFAKIYVKDNGIGFDQNEADQVFEFMKRLNKGDGKNGTGIGLSTCKKIVENHGGEIGVKSTPGEGSTFYFTLKLA